MRKQTIQPEEICTFWLNAGPEKWFAKDADFDLEIKTRFYELWQKAMVGRLNHWKETNIGLTALIIILDQFPRHMFRNDPRAFCSDVDARKLANLALERGISEDIAPQLRPFLYLPFEHSENINDQKRSLELFKKLGDKEMFKSAQTHYDIIERFGHFPHRNPIIGRKIHEEEQAFLDNGGFFG